MENINKMSLLHLKPEQIQEIEKHIQKLITLIKEQFVEKSDDWEQYNFVFNLDTKVIDNLVKLFHESKLFYKHSVDIAEQYDSISNELSLYNDPEIFRVVYPVLFFTLIVKNELNKETIDSRLERGTTSWGNKCDVFQVPSWGPTPVKEPKSFINMKEALIQQKTRLKEIKHRSLPQQKILKLAESAEVLLDYENIIETEISANFGLFVGSILKYVYRVEKNSKTNSTANIDTVIRLFLINEYNGIISDAGILSNGVISLIPEKNLLTEYYTENKVSLQTIIGEDESKTVPEKKDKIRFEHPSHKNRCTIKLTDSDCPTDLYSGLVQLPTFTDDDIEDMLEHFFSEKLLQWYTEYYKNIKKHVLKIIQAKDDVGLIVDDYELEILYALINAEYTRDLLWLEK